VNHFTVDVLSVDVVTDYGDICLCLCKSYWQQSKRFHLWM